jgi:hypothetical protein
MRWSDTTTRQRRDPSAAADPSTSTTANPTSRRYVGCCTGCGVVTDHYLGADYHTRRIDTERRTRSHVRQLEALGYNVTFIAA